MEKVAFPTRKRRHPKVDYKELARKSQENYVDFREAG